MSPPPSRRTTAADVAAAAGVSRATASYVLNRHPHQKIPERTRQRVWDAAARLGYSPSAAAPTLRSGRSDVVLCLLPDWGIGDAVGRGLEELGRALAARGLTMLVHPAGGRTAAPLREICRAVTPAVVVTFEPLTPEEAQALRAAGVETVSAPFDTVDRAPATPGVSEQRVGRLQVQHLASRGHRRLGYAHTEDPRLDLLTAPRLEGARQACADLGLPAPVEQVVPTDAGAAGAALGAFLDRDEPVTGVCAYDDQVAVAVLAGLWTRGLRAPDDLAVIGVDDIPRARVSLPPLTTVARDVPALARTIAARVEHVLGRTSEAPRPAAHALHVVVRGST